jgi:hypothetical protein
MILHFFLNLHLHLYLIAQLLYIVSHLNLPMAPFDSWAVILVLLFDCVISFSQLLPTLTRTTTTLLSISQRHGHSSFYHPSTTIAEGSIHDDYTDTRPSFEELDEVLNSPLLQRSPLQGLIEADYFFPNNLSILSLAGQSSNPSHRKTLFFSFDGKFRTAPSDRMRATEIESARHRSRLQLPKQAFRHW